MTYDDADVGASRRVASVSFFDVKIFNIIANGESSSKMMTGCLVTPSLLCSIAAIPFSVLLWPIKGSAGFGDGSAMTRCAGWQLRQNDQKSKSISSRQSTCSQFHSLPSLCGPARSAVSPSALYAWPWDEDEELITEREEAASALKKAETEALRYENRAARLEGALKNRTAELKLMKNRVIILQDVARKLKQDQNKTVAELAVFKAKANERDSIEATLNATYDELDRQTTKLQKLLGDEKRARKEVVLQYDDLMNELERKDMELQNAQEKTKRDLSELERRLKAERRGRKKDRDEFDRITSDLKARLEAATNVVKEMEVELNRTVADIETLRKEGKNDDREARAVAKEEQKKRQFLKQELVAARMAEREALEELERLKERYVKQKELHAAKESEWEKNMTIANGERADKDKAAVAAAIIPSPQPQKSLDNDRAVERAKERVEIATASVRAAEMREETARNRLEKVQDELQSVLKDNDRLSVELSDALDRQNVAMERLETFRSSHGRREEALAKRVARAEQNLRQVEEEMDLLRGERDGVRDALLSERLKFAGERREEQIRYDRIMRDERDGYETEVSLLKEQLSRLATRTISTIADAGPPVAQQDANADSRDRQLSKMNSEESAEQSKNKKRRGRLGRAWRRIKSPRSWFAA